MLMETINESMRGEETTVHFNSFFDFDLLIGLVFTIVTSGLKGKRGKNVLG